MGKLIGIKIFFREKVARVSMVRLMPNRMMMAVLVFFRFSLSLLLICLFPNHSAMLSREGPVKLLWQLMFTVTH